MSKADYLHEITEYNGFKCLKIEDLNLGNISVTNDIENVVADIAQMERIDPSQFIIVYKDSEGNWDGWDPLKELHVSINKPSFFSAVREYLAHVNGR